MTTSLVSECKKKKKKKKKKTEKKKKKKKKKRKKRKKTEKKKVSCGLEADLNHYGNKFCRRQCISTAGVRDTGLQFLVR